MDLTDRAERDRGRGLHERDLGRRLDHAAGVDERLAGDDRPIEAAHLADVVDDEMAGRVLDRERLTGGQVGAGLGDQLEGALVFVPGTDIGGDRQALLDGGYFEERRDDDGLAGGRDQRCGRAFRAPPADAGEILERRAGLDEAGGDLPVAHQRLELGHADLAFCGGDRLRFRGSLRAFVHGLRRRYVRPAREQCARDGRAEEESTVERCHPASVSRVASRPPCRRGPSRS